MRPSQILCKYGDRCNYPLNSHGLVSAQNPGVKEDPERFTKRPMQEYLDDESAPKF
ncbi:hypothetical protein [Psychrobacter alimentarius]|uniref:hypothetical protein n=1 Tax=Psychrobacter alimentarius TaxID=261164 RepID=UPI00191B0BA8|nr:hypothetical protein [Psychrobacter alimentarius]